MKRLISLVAALLLLFACPAPGRTLAARADDGTESGERYAVAATENVWFYASENEESGLFLLPYTYYVKVLREGTLYSAVQYLDDLPPGKALLGFCKTEALTFVDFIPERPFLRKEIKVTYTVGEDTPMGNGSFDRIERSFVYYGTSYAGTARYFYVYADGVFDYVPATCEILFDLNTDYLKPSASLPPAEEEPSVSSPSVVQIVVLCVVGAAAVAVALLVLRAKRSPLPQETEF